MIKNFADLKRAIQAKTPFLIVEHYTRPEFSQKIRIPTVVLSRGFYSIVKDSPDATETLANNGKGIWMEFGKAGDWTFDGEFCEMSFQGRKIYKILFSQKQMKLFARVDAHGEIPESEMRKLIAFSQNAAPTDEERKGTSDILEKVWPGHNGYIPGCILDDAADKLGIKWECGCSDIDF